jgi:hypothetical protein
MGAVMSGTAWAHFLTVTASASCVSGVAVISYTAVSWNPGGTGGSNTEIDIFLTASRWTLSRSAWPPRPRTSSPGSSQRHPPPIR